MGFFDLFSKCVQAFVLPQECVVCSEPVCEPDWSPLCGSCRVRLREPSGIRCRLCGLLLTLLDEGGCCGRCLREDPGFDRVATAGDYRGALRQVLHGYKFGGHRRLAGPLAQLIARVYRAELANGTWDCLIPIPIHPRRLRSRGFDQVGRLCRYLEPDVGLPLLDVVVRVRPTLPQRGLTVDQRRRNLHQAFRLRAQPGVRDALIVDDILTTGATAREIAGLLRSSGVRQVGVLTVARTPVWRGEANG